MFSSFCFRAQNLHRRLGQRWQDHDPVSVFDERSSADVADYRVERGGGRLEKYSLHHVGLRWTRITQSSLEYVLLKHRGDFFLNFQKCVIKFFLF